MVPTTCIHIATPFHACVFTILYHGITIGFRVIISSSIWSILSSCIVIITLIPRPIYTSHLSHSTSVYFYLHFKIYYCGSYLSKADTIGTIAAGSLWGGVHILVSFGYFK